MTEDSFDTSLRKFLKTVGVTSQQRIEQAVREARARGQLPPALRARMTLRVEELGLEHVVEGEIRLDEA
ncbi:DUF6494 family protein [Oceanicella actignis]|uniref:Uncharacterized protein n=1 Tax=Oceanicella actignis TaxID=1189325 RepID=A0A1M7TV83_9RHOB|nr:DUF6494 family protein [Oceanicella actignis]TYO90474.1 hypothetical protein LY05_00603 [Oceanicella actignis]SES79359.1 hypothetical protein SAMN04488119_101486 [Oceanicella actignis]SHN74523.1 hypothetical protein SAMN05216200_11066 [Oceanicella actignis]